MDESGEDPVARLAAERFGVRYLYPLQRLVMANILDAPAGEEVLRQVAIFPTGFGKSLCFQLPALLLPGPTIVIYPLLALVEDQRRRLEASGIPCAVFKGGMAEDEKASAREGLSSGRTKLVLTNPESLRGSLLGFLSDLRPSHVAVDEAHCVSEWGRTFRPAYLELGQALETLAPRVTTAFTATASPPVLEAVSRILFMGGAATIVEADPDRPNIHYSVVRSLSRERALESLLARLERPAIVFTSSRDGVQILAERLRSRLTTEELRFYHAGLTKGERRAIEEWFLTSADGILTSTCAYGMGLDKKNIRTVIHFEPPPSIEAYLQESGRAGRDGLPARAILLSGPWDSSLLARDADDPARRERRAALLDYAAQEEGCRRDSLLRILGTGLASPCSGCDLCDGDARQGFEGEAQMVDFIRHNPRRFDDAGALRFLCGEGCLEPPRGRAWGSLAGWRSEDVAVALSGAKQLGILRERRGWLWKGKLEEGKALQASSSNPAEASAGADFLCLSSLRGGGRLSRARLKTTPA